MFFEDFKLEKELIFIEKQGNFEEHELHIHDVLEYHILLENKAKFQLTDKQYDGVPGDVFLFRPFEPHWNLVEDSSRPIRWISILFSPSIVRFIPGGYKLLSPFYVMEAISPYIPASSPGAQAIQQLAALAISEEKNKQIGWEAKQFNLFVDILVHTLRHTIGGDRSLIGKLDGSGDPTGLGEPIDQSIIKVIEYILAHFSEEIDIDQLVRMTGRKRSFFYQKFRTIIGVTPNLFIHRLRMQVAIYLLSKSNKLITEIAFECGYASIHYFNKHFKAYRGISPRAFRQSIARHRPPTSET